MAQSDGFTQDELLAIGTRKTTHDFNISAADINSPLPYVVAQELHKRIDGFSNDQLKIIGERRAQIPSMQPDEINNPRVGMNEAVETVLNKLQRFLGVRLK